LALSGLRLSKLGLRPCPALGLIWGRILQRQRDARGNDERHDHE
jgi:hypothetical protein